MRLKSLHESGKQILAGFKFDLKNFLLKTGRFLGLGALIGFLGFLAVFPLWFFSTHHRRGYSIFVLSVLAFLLIFLLTRRLIRSYKQHANAVSFLRHIILPAVVKIGRVSLYILSIYGIVLLYVYGLYLAAVSVSLIFLLLLAYFKYGR